MSKKLRHAAILGAVILSLLTGLPAEAQTSAPSLQAEMRMALGNRGAAVVLRVSDGKVLAAYNRAVLGRRVASPGSAIKPFVLLRLLESGLLRPEETFSCRRNLQIGGRRMDCTHPAELTHFDAAQALAFSCNSYFATAAARLRPEELEKLYLELGFTHPTGKLPDEAEGRVLRARDRGEMQLQALGSADVWVTPIELAVAYLRLARAAAGSPSAAQKTVLAGLRGAVDYGIASEASVDGMAVSGKTGTAADASGQPTHAWFAGFAPSKHPEIVVLVFVESGSGRASAAPVAQRILRAWKAGAR